jgi:hypothetical protein
MKKLVLFFVVLCMSHFMMGQEHMKFKGVEIDGTLTEMVTKLKAKGFTYLGAEDGIAMLKGDFAGYRDCQIVVLSMKETGKVNAIGVAFPEREDWSSLEGDYDRLKSMLTEKYGEPSRVIERFNKDYVPDNWWRFNYITSDEAIWASIFEMLNGTIELYMNKVDYNKAAVILKYYDKANTDVVRASAMDDL